MIRRCGETEFETIREIINDAAQAYKGVIPPTVGQSLTCPRTNYKKR